MANFECQYLQIPVSGGRATQRGTGGGPPGGSGDVLTLPSKMGGMSLGAGASGDGLYTFYFEILSDLM